MRLILMLLQQTTPEQTAGTAGQTLPEQPLTATLVGVVVFLVAAFVLMVFLVIRTGVGRKTLPQGERSWLDYGNLYVVSFGIAAALIGFLVILLFLNTFEDTTQALGFLTALFGAIVGLVGTFFGIKSSSDAAEGAQRLVGADGRDTTRPQVSSTNPADQEVNVSPDVHPTATFSKDMDRATINDTTFKLLDQNALHPVDGEVAYDEPTRVATFTPAAPLENGPVYEATITAGVKDKSGNALAQDKTWHFTVM